LAAGQGFATIQAGDEFRVSIATIDSVEQAMSEQFKTIALVGRFEDPRVAEPMSLLAAHLTGAGLRVIASPPIASVLDAEPCEEADFAASCDLIVAIGGDGTMLYAAELGRRRDIPLLGVNRGRLGFLADITPTEMLDSMDQVLRGEYARESRLLIHASIVSADGSERSAVALNDVVLQRRDTGRMLDFETRIAGRFVNTHSGDGLIVATPTGSTAYALSCGGPIIEPLLDAVVVVPICPHTLSDRPIVVPAEQTIELHLLAREDTQADVAVDGHNLGELTPTDRLGISRADSRISLIHPPGYDYYEILRSKLHWGRDSRFADGADALRRHD
jgi:NAD+ kinase